MERKLSKVPEIDLMKGLLPIAVIVLHCSEASGLDWRTGAEPFIRVLLMRICYTAVPVFFCISGFLFFRGMEKWEWSRWGGKMKKRLRTLVLPYILWIIISFLCQYAFNYLKGGIDTPGFVSLREFFAENGGLRMFWDKPVPSESGSILGYTISCGRPMDPPLWFIRDLFDMCLIAPAIWALLRFCGRYGVIALGSCYILNIGIPFTGFSPSALFFFSLGAFLALDGRESPGGIRGGTLWWSLIALACLLVTYFNGPLPYQYVLNLWVATASICFIKILSQLSVSGSVKPSEMLVGASFFIYASHHPLMIEFSNFLLWRTMPFAVPAIQILKIFLRPAVTLGLCLVIYLLLKKIMPRALAVLTGGRI